MGQTTPRDALVIGGDVVSLTVATFPARTDLDTFVINDDEPTVRRDAHPENVPGFPTGVNSRLFTGLLSEQANRNGAGQLTGRVTDLDVLDNDEDLLFQATVETDDSEEIVEVSRVVTASWSDASYLEDTGVDLRAAGSKTHADVDGPGRTDILGIYVTGRLTEIYHQAVVAVDDAAETVITLVYDSGTVFYNDRVAPTSYFTSHGHEVLPVCEEIDADERAHRERESREVMHEFFAEPHDEPQRTHPSLADDGLGRLDG